MTAGWITILVLCIGTAASKAAGSLATGGREPGVRTLSVTRLVAPAILAGLVTYETFSAAGDGITLDARVVGVLAAVGGIAAKLPMIAIVVLAAAATALTRALAG